MPEDGIVCLDNGMYKIWFARNYRTRIANTLLLDNALATMGAGLPSAIAAKLLHPDRRVMAVCGDGGFLMNSQELETAVRLRLDLVVLIVEDLAYGMIRWKQAVDGFADFGMTFGNPDFVLYARAYGAYGHRVTRAADLAPTLAAAFEAGGVHIVTVPVDYSENVRVSRRRTRPARAGIRGRLRRPRRWSSGHRCDPVISVDSLAVIVIGEGVFAGPEPWRVGQLYSNVDIDNVAAQARVICQRTPRQRMIALAEPEEAAERHHDVGDLARDFVDHEIVDGPDLLPRRDRRRAVPSTLFEAMRRRVSCVATPSPDGSSSISPAGRRARSFGISVGMWSGSRLYRRVLLR